MEVFEIIKSTPLRTLAVVIGFIAISVGYGLKIKAVIDVENINRTYAKTIGVILLVLGIALYLSDMSLSINISQSGKADPFLIYYVISVPIIVALFAAASKFTSGQTQIRTLKIFFVFVAILISLAVLWRAIDVYFFVTSSGKLNVPMGLYTKGNYLPYLILLSAGVIVITSFFYINTRQPENSENRIPIFQYFSVFCMYLGVCRLGWEIVDYVAKMKIPAVQ
jgi:hypothetical protein